MGYEDTVALIVDEQDKMGAFIALEQFVNVDGQLGMQLQCLAALVIGLDRERPVESRHRFRIAALIKLDPGIEIQRGR